MKAVGHNVIVYLLSDESAWTEFHRNRFSNDFDKVAFVKKNLFTKYETVSFGTDLVGEDAAEEAFDLSNNPCRNEERARVWGKRPSLSVGDVVEVFDSNETSTAYMCDSFGWVAI